MATSTTCMTLESSYLLLFATCYIGSLICFTARQPHASPRAYQSLALGDNAPDPLIKKLLATTRFHNGGGTVDSIKMKSKSAMVSRKNTK